MTAADHPVSPEDLMACLDGELPRAQAAIVEAHVAGCDGCQRSTSDLRGVSRDLARWQVEDAPGTLTAPWPLPGKAKEPRSRFGWFLKPSVSFAAFVLVAVGLAGVVTYQPMFSNRVPMADSFEPSAATSQTDRRGEIPTDHKRRSMAGAELPVFAGSPVPPYAGGASALALQPKFTPAIARLASLRFTTRDFEATRSAVDRIVAEMDGWFGHVSVSPSGQGRSLTAALHVPAARLDAALAALKALGTVLEESMKGEDVTEQIVDVEARLSNARNTEKRLLDLLQRRTGALEEVLAAERELARVREEVERFDAQRKNLEGRVTYATLNLNVLEATPATLSLGPQPVRIRFRDAFVTGLTQAVDSALQLALLLVRVAPTLILWSAMLGWPVLALVRWSRRHLNPEP